MTASTATSCQRSEPSLRDTYSCSVSPPLKLPRAAPWMSLRTVRYMNTLETTTSTITSVTNSSARRMRARAKTSGRVLSDTGSPAVAEHVADPAHRLEPARPSGRIDLAPQPADVHVDDVREGVELVIPGVVEDVIAAQHAARVAHEQLEEAELLGAQSERVTAQASFTPRRIEAEYADRERGRQGVARPPQQRPQPRQQLLEGERLHEVVVGAAVEAGHLVVGRVPRREHQHRDGQAPAPQLTAQSEAVDARQHHVEHEQVVGQLGGVARSAAPGREAAARGVP